jgi:hypothetical protein
MANQVANKGNGAQAIMPQSQLFDRMPDEWDDLTANVAISFPILGIKSGRWHYRFRGEDQIIMDAQGRFPTPAVHVVILKAQKELSRTYYATGYVEGANAPPDCWSSDGVAPDASVAQPINPVCATCPCDAWGSGATPAAPKAKACQQRRRTVVVLYSNDLTNEAGGGPILLSVPPGSLTNQVAYGNMLREHRVHYAGVVTELSFTQDPNVAFPKIEFTYVKSLTDDEAQVIIGLRDHEQVGRILQSKMVPAEMETSAPTDETAHTRPQAPPPPPPQPPVRPAPRPSVVRAPVPPQAQPQPQPAPTPPPPPPNKVGGYAMGPATRAAAQPTQAASPGTIAGAMRTPAAPPPTQRPIIKQAGPVVEPEGGEHADAAGQEPEANERAVPADMDKLFNSLMTG